MIKPNPEYLGERKNLITIIDDRIIRIDYEKNHNR